LTDTNYRITEQRIAEIDELLETFVGTHNFFNYTAEIEHDDQRCKRYIISFKCDKLFIYRDEHHNVDVEFITLYVRGQSFMMHQIRKMVGVIIAISRGMMYKSDLQKSFEQLRMDIPKAPGNGLLLERLHYGRYDERFAKSHATIDDWGEEIEQKVLDVKQQLITSNILRHECETQSMMDWLSCLHMHRFACDPEDESEAGSTSKLHEASVTAYTAINGSTREDVEAAAELDELADEESQQQVIDEDELPRMNHVMKKVELPLKKVAGGQI